MVRSIIAAAGLLAVASAGVTKRSTPLADSCDAGWKYNECIEITSGYPVIGDDPSHFTDGYTPKACQAFCMKHKKDGKPIKYAAVTADFCECYGEELMSHKSTQDENKCQSPCPGKEDFYCGSYVKGTPGDWYYAVYECTDDKPTDQTTKSEDDKTTTSDYKPTTSSHNDKTTSADHPATTHDEHKGDEDKGDKHKGEHPQITSTVYETVVETITKCPETVKDCPHKKTKTITTTTCYDASTYTKSYDETVTVTECPKTVVDCPYRTKPTTSIKPCSSVVTYDPSASYVCGKDLCAKPTGGSGSWPNQPAGGSSGSSPNYPAGGSSGSSPNYPAGGSSGSSPSYPAGGSSGSSPNYPAGASGSSSTYPSCSGKSCESKTSNSTYPAGSASGCEGKDCYKTAGAGRETVVASVALIAGLGLGVAALL